MEGVAGGMGPPYQLPDGRRSRPPNQLTPIELGFQAPERGFERFTVTFVYKALTPNPREKIADALVKCSLLEVSRRQAGCRNDVL